MTLKKIIIQLILRYRQFIQYCLIGITGVSIDALLFYTLVNHVHMHYQWANTISVTCGICNNFFWNAFLNFKQTDKLLKRFLTFYAVGFLGLGISALLLYAFIETLDFNIVISKLCVIIVVTLIQFYLNRTYTFHGK